MKKIIIFLLIKFIGILILLASMWIGAYFLNIYGYETWQQAPIFFTALIFFAIGLILIVMPGMD